MEGLKGERRAESGAVRLGLPAGGERLEPARWNVQVSEDAKCVTVGGETRSSDCARLLSGSKESMVYLLAETLGQRQEVAAREPLLVIIINSKCNSRRLKCTPRLLSCNTFMRNNYVQRRKDGG